MGNIRPEHRTLAAERELDLDQLAPRKAYLRVDAVMRRGENDPGSRWLDLDPNTDPDNDEPGDDHEAALQDALTDLLHWADHFGLDFWVKLEAALRMHQSEIDDPLP